MEKIEFTDNAIEAGIAAANEAANDASFSNNGGDFCYGITLKLGFVVAATGQPDFDAAAKHAAELHSRVRENSGELVAQLTRALLLSGGVSRITTTVQSVLEAVIAEETDASD